MSCDFRASICRCSFIFLPIWLSISLVASSFVAIYISPRAKNPNSFLDFFQRALDFGFSRRQFRLHWIKLAKTNGFFGLRQISTQNLRCFEFERIEKHFSSISLLVDVPREQQSMSIHHSFSPNRSTAEWEWELECLDPNPSNSIHQRFDSIELRRAADWKESSKDDPPSLRLRSTSYCTELDAQLRGSESALRGAHQNRIFADFRWRRCYRKEWFPRIKSGAFGLHPPLRYSLWFSLFWSFLTGNCNLRSTAPRTTATNDSKSYSRATWHAVDWQTGFRWKSGHTRRF